jgi:hypothetical protein
MAQRIARRWLVSPLIHKELRVGHPLLARGNFASVNPNHQKCARAGMWVRKCDVLGQDDLCYRAVTTRQAAPSEEPLSHSMTVF